MNRESLSLKLIDQKLFVLDQQLLPQKEVWILVESIEHLIFCIKELKVRGAPLIGVTAAIALAVHSDKEESRDSLLKNLTLLRNARPTAVNLMNAMDRMANAIKNFGLDRSQLMLEAIKIFDQDLKLCEEMARVTAELISSGEQVLTHCNTGGLATVGIGTALGAIIYAHQNGKKIHVYVDETRPLLQGARLTTWELEKNKIPYTLICDNMASVLMKHKKITRVLVGADRICSNGDFANKIGTYSLAVNCQFHGIPFHVVAPKTTLDLTCKNGSEIPIEQRSKNEVLGLEGSFGKVTWAPENAICYNPSFDVTPFELVTTMTVDNVVYSQKDLIDGKLKEIN